MKKAIITIISILLALGIMGGGYIFYKTTTPEYALAKMIADAKESGITGIEEHLTEDTRQKVEQIIEWSENPLVTGILSATSESEEISLLTSKISEIDWSVEDILKGKNQAEVVIGFNYNEQVIGTVNIVMLRENHKWKISGIELPSFDKVFD